MPKMLDCPVEPDWRLALEQENDTVHVVAVDRNNVNSKQYLIEFGPSGMLRQLLVPVEVAEALQINLDSEGSPMFEDEMV